MGLVASDMVRRLVTRTIAQQIRGLVERATSPFQCALSTRAGTECIAHAIQAITDADSQSKEDSREGCHAEWAELGGAVDGLQRNFVSASARVDLDSKLSWS